MPDNYLAELFVQTTKECRTNMKEKSTIIFAALLLLCMLITIGSSVDPVSVHTESKAYTPEVIITKNNQQRLSFSPHIVGKQNKTKINGEGIELYIIKTGYEQFDKYCDLSGSFDPPPNLSD